MKKCCVGFSSGITKLLYNEGYPPEWGNEISQKILDLRNIKDNKIF